MTPTGRLIAYREYQAGERSAAEHCHYLMKGDDKNPPEPRIPLCAGGSKSEGQWRREFAAGGTIKTGLRVAGVPIHGPAKSDASSSGGRNRSGVWDLQHRQALGI